MTIAMIQSILNYVLYVISIASVLLFIPVFIDFVIYRRLTKGRASDSKPLSCNSNKTVSELQNESQSASNQEFIDELIAIPATHRAIQLPTQWLTLQRLAQLQDITKWNRMKRSELEEQLRLSLACT